ncbi:MAG: hypothetical protein HQM09_10460 [Candidatus Riflebacteria bacterium]|nr:hypothetical protein [Candidatus Riflebacteria bacterium]
MLKHNFGKLLLVCFLFSFVCINNAFTMPHQVGQYTVEIEVRNSIQIPIPGARVVCSLSGKVIHVRASAAGYLSRTISISADHGDYFQRDIILSDIPKSISIEDWNEVPLTAAYFLTDQYGFAPDAFGITVYIPIEAWPNASLQRVLLFDEFLGKLNVVTSLDKTDDFYCLKFVIPRKTFGQTSNRLHVVFDTRVPVTPKASEVWLSRLERLEKTDKPSQREEVYDFSQILGQVLPHEDLEKARTDGVLPHSLEPLVGQFIRFDCLHRDSPELQQK